MSARLAASQKSYYITEDVIMNHEMKIIDMFSRIFELLLLNLLFVLTSLPLVTVGASRKVVQRIYAEQDQEDQ
mgnify:CR=1 FL=1